MTAKDLTALLKAKHAEDVVVTECKFGPTGFTGSCRIDVWVMPRSWARPAIQIYETKVSRSDFLADHKWQIYLPYCNQFWWVTAPGVCTKAEISPGCGWMESSLTGSRLWTRVKAPFVERPIPEGIFRYILMSRVKIIGEYEPNPMSRERVQSLLESKAEDIHFGRLAGRRIHQLVKDRISKVETENRELVARYKAYDDIRETLGRLGLNPRHASTWAVERKIADFQQVVPAGLESALSHAHTGLGLALNKIEAIKKT
jgi:hypothetical protein